METLVPPALAASAPERARAVQALLDAHGPEMDRRRELTPEVIGRWQADRLKVSTPVEETRKTAGLLGAILQRAVP